MAGGENLIAKLLRLNCLRLEIGEGRMGGSNVDYKQELMFEDVGRPAED